VGFGGTGTASSSVASSDGGMRVSLRPVLDEVTRPMTRWLVMLTAFLRLMESVVSSYTHARMMHRYGE